MTVTTITDAELAPKDYASDQEVRWCPGCGDYAILKAVQKALAELGAPRALTLHTAGLDRVSGVAVRVRPRRRSALRRPGRGHTAAGGRGALETGSCASRGVVRRGVPELRCFQRRGVRSLHVERRGE